MENFKLKELSLQEKKDINGGDLLGGIAAIAGVAVAIYTAGISIGRDIYKSLH